MDWVIVLALGLAAGTISGIVGFGTSIILLPALVIVFGPREAVPIMAITAILANLSRMGVWWRDVDWKVCTAYSCTAIPFAGLGATTLLSLSTRMVELSMGVFFLLMIPGRRWLQATGFKMMSELLPSACWVELPSNPQLGRSASFGKLLNSLICVLLRRLASGV